MSSTGLIRSSQSISCGGAGDVDSGERLDGPAFQKSRDRFRCLEASAESLLPGRPADMGSEDDVVHREQGLLDERLVLEDIKGGSREVA